MPTTKWAWPKRTKELADYKMGLDPTTKEHADYKMGLDPTTNGTARGQKQRAGKT